MRQLDAATWAAGQIHPTEIARLAADGFTLIVNNRPDGEDPDQPAGAAIEAAAAAAGLDYRHIPVSGGINGDDVLAMAEALGGAQGKVLAFCRAGIRSTFLWALARSELGASADEIVAGAAAAGVDLGPIRGLL
ncbi:TIGR01244 family sulfur transferase [Allosphingosinicella sp.]|jgi:uncharacterized protein (TIGR01244 family)|uniref:TIGR01244 family sulfur transferase n=1 Tax=Allosphingosinicella sp. TaxID=2823234 RepID=UPI002EDBCAA4